jgi:hypothetical protein
MALQEVHRRKGAVADLHAKMVWAIVGAPGGLQLLAALRQLRLVDPLLNSFLQPLPAALLQPSVSSLEQVEAYLVEAGPAGWMQALPLLVVRVLGSADTLLRTAQGHAKIEARDL